MRVAAVALALAAIAPPAAVAPTSGVADLLPPPARGGHARPIPPRGGRAIVVLDPIGSLDAWWCIHAGAWPDGRDVPGTGEGSWTANTGNGYHGGLQMDRGFEKHYGADMLARYGGDAELWTPRDQMVVAERARASGRGYGPWPVTARNCGLL